MLYLNVGFGDTLSLDDGRIRLSFQKRSSKEIKVGFDADRNVTAEIIPSRGRNPAQEGLSNVNAGGRKSDHLNGKSRAHEGRKE